MAVTDSNLSITKTRETILIATSDTFKVQNLSSKEVRFCVKDSGIRGGVIGAGETTSFDYDIDIWCEIDVGVASIYVVRD